MYLMIVIAFMNKYQYIRWQIPLEYIKFITFHTVITITVKIISSHFCSVLITTFSEIWNFRASYIQRIRGIHYTLWPFQYSITALLKILLIFLVYCSSLSCILWGRVEIGDLSRVLYFWTKDTWNLHSTVYLTIPCSLCLERVIQKIFVVLWKWRACKEQHLFQKHSHWWKKEEYL